MPPKAISNAHIETFPDIMTAVPSDAVVANIQPGPPGTPIDSTSLIQIIPRDAMRPKCQGPLDETPRIDVMRLQSQGPLDVQLLSEMMRLSQYHYLLENTVQTNTIGPHIVRPDHSHSTVDLSDASRKLQNSCGEKPNTVSDGARALSSLSKELEDYIEKVTRRRPDPFTDDQMRELMEYDLRLALEILGVSEPSGDPSISPPALWGLYGAAGLTVSSRAKWFPASNCRSKGRLAKWQKVSSPMDQIAKNVCEMLVNADKLVGLSTDANLRGEIFQGGSDRRRNKGRKPTERSTAYRIARKQRKEPLDQAIAPPQPTRGSRPGLSNAVPLISTPMTHFTGTQSGRTAANLPMTFGQGASTVQLASGMFAGVPTYPHPQNFFCPDYSVSSASR